MSPTTVSNPLLPSHHVFNIVHQNLALYSSSPDIWDFRSSLLQEVTLDLPQDELRDFTWVKIISFLEFLKASASFSKGKLDSCSRTLLEHMLSFPGASNRWMVPILKVLYCPVFSFFVWPLNLTCNCQWDLSQFQSV